MGRRQFPREFKIVAVRLVREQGVSVDRAACLRIIAHLPIKKIGAAWIEDRMAIAHFGMALTN